MLTDIRFALRQLAKTPSFTVIALLTLAVGIGSATVVFSAINAFLFKPLPLITVAEDRLVYCTEIDTARGPDDLGWNYLDYVALRQRATTLAGAWVHNDLTAIIGGTEIPERLRGSSITWDAFDLMGVQPLHGRNFTAADAAPGADNVVLISAAVWRTRYGSALDAVGKTITLNGQPATIIGVMPAGWRYPEFSDLWVPFRTTDDKAKSRGYFGLSGRARLKEGVTLQQARTEATAIMGALAREHPQTNTGINVRFQPIREEAVQDTVPFTLLLFGAVGFVFLIACVNVANLLLARSVSRSKEVAIRLALGAGRRRVVRQLITESVVLGLLGGIGGLILGLWGNDAVVAALPIDIPFWLRFDFDLAVFGFVFGLSVVAALVFGLAPALRASQPDLVSELKEGGRSAETSGPRALRLRNVLVTIEIALALVLLVGAGLMMRSFLELRRLDPGFDPHRVLTFRTGWPVDMMRGDRDAPQRFFDELLGKLSALPGVESAGLVNWLPGRNGIGYLGGFVLEGEARPSRPTDAHPAQLRTVSPGYFQTLRIPLKAGRTFDDAIDRQGTPRVLIVDEAFATRFFGSPAAAIGRHIAEYRDHAAPGGGNNGESGFSEIIGVVGGIRHHLDRADDYPTVYSSCQQSHEAFHSLVLRVQGDPSAYAKSAHDAAAAVNRDIPIYDVFPLEQVTLRSETVWPRRFFGYLFTVFGAVAVFLACIGIYGLMSYNVTQRVQELGVRLALGAQPQQVIRLVVRHGLRLVACGVAAGFVAAFLLANFLRGVLYGVSPHDPPTFALVPLLLAGVAIFACWLPSRRATLIEPNAALRSE